MKITDDPLKNKTMRTSIAEGSFGVLSSMVSDNYIVPFALSLNSTPLQIGILSSLGNLISPVGQIIGSYGIEKISRKSVILSGVIGMAAIWPLYIVLALIFEFETFDQLLPWFLLGLFLIYMCAAGIISPAWFSVMGDVVPENFRGRYFAKRNVISNTIALLGILILSFSLDWFELQGAIFLGFILIFFIGFITRIMSVILFTKQHYPPFHIEVSERVKFLQIIKEIPKTNFGKFTLFVSLIMLGQWISGPFYAVYMLNELHFTYSIFILINMFPSIVSLFFFPLLGKLCDKFGNVRMLQLGSIIIPLLPILWMLFITPIGILFVPQLLNGIGWTAFNLACSNFIYDNIPTKKIGTYIAFYNSLLGISILIGGLIGSLIITYIPINFMNAFHFLFLISGIVRIIVVVILLPKIKEIRVTTKPITNLKNMTIYRWLYDLTLRNHQKSRKKKRQEEKQSKEI
ncbi:MAG: MFS transporter [Candidatus Thorarchaeota archaeon]